MEGIVFATTTLLLSALPGVAQSLPSAISSSTLAQVDVFRAHVFVDFSLALTNIAQASQILASPLIAAQPGKQVNHVRFI